MISQQEMHELTCTFVPSEWEKLKVLPSEHIQRVYCHNCTVLSNDTSAAQYCVWAWQWTASQSSIRFNCTESNWGASFAYTEPWNLWSTFTMLFESPCQAYVLPACLTWLLWCKITFAPKLGTMCPHNPVTLMPLNIAKIEHAVVLQAQPRKLWARCHLAKAC
jgi:hypothetical protein